MHGTIPTDSAKHAFLTGLIDDASLFPPASLPMREALRAHARHAESAYAWLGGRFVLAASRADEFAAARDPQQSITISAILDAAALGAKGDTITADLHRIDRVRALPAVTVDALEAKIPAGLDDAGLGRAIDAIVRHFPDGGVAFWYELPHTGSGWAASLGDTMGQLAAARAAAPGHVVLGAKLRCGGPRPSDVPSVGDVGAFVRAAQEHGVPWKATAGLHQPVRHGTSHGFVNVFAAGMLLHGGAIDASRLADVIGEHDPRAFVIDPMHVAWRDARIDAESAAAARAQCVSFGRCSFDEQVNALRGLGLLA